MYGLSTLIIGSNEGEIRKTIEKLLKEEDGIPNLKSFEVLELGIEEKSIGIDLIRSAQGFLRKKPVNSRRNAVVIYNAKKLSLEAQNALLKTLEEPNRTSHLILVSDNADQLLPTVTSRCKKITIRETYSPDKHLEELAEKFLTSRVGERLFLIDSNKEILTVREEALKFLDALNFVIRKDLKKENVEMAGKISKVQRDLSSTNLNVRLAMEYLALN